MEHDPRDPSITVDEAAAVLGVTPRQFREWIARGILRPQRKGRDYAVRWTDIGEVWKSRQEPMQLN